MIDFENISKSFGTRNLFNSSSFKIVTKNRIGLVGRNGHGKTTLLNIIVGKETLDDGKLTIPRNYRIGYVRQSIRFSKKTILEEGMKSLIESEKDYHWKVSKILSGLGFSETDMKKDPNKFSGGFQVRLNLAKVLISEPNLLLLDEPTNYLDITSIRWIEKFLVDWPNELIVVTHDRSFMDKVITHTVGIHRNKIRKIKGNTNKYYKQIAKDEDIYEKTRINREKKKKETISFVERFRAKARLAGMVQSRIKLLNKTKKNHKLEKLRSLDFSFKSKPYGSQNVLTSKNLSFAYKNQKFLFSSLSFSVKSKENICIIGKNGKGKSTLLRIIAGLLQPKTGTISFNPQIVKGFFEQTNVDSMLESRTVEEEILCSHTDVTRNQARTICGAMMFEDNLAFKKINVLSGGEKSRVMLGKLSVTPLNLLLLDEPTNHLDMHSCDALLSAINNFDGTVIMVTHNEMFLHSIANRLIIFEGGEANIFEGCYQQFLDDIGWKEESYLSKKQKSLSQKLSKKDIRRIRSSVIKAKSKRTNPIKTKMIDAENIIQDYETKLNQLHQDLICASQESDGSRIKCLSQEAYNCEKIIEKQFENLETMEQQLRQIEIHFDKKLSGLDCRD